MNYSLRTVERILAEQNTFQLKHSDASSRVPHTSRSLSWQSGAFNINQHSSNDVSTDLFRIVDVLPKPTQNSGAPDQDQSQQKFKKKRKRSHHL